ncbi:10238_t:CDS:1, partial [Acaulospora colombiana]
MENILNNSKISIIRNTITNDIYNTIMLTNSQTNETQYTTNNDPNKTEENLKDTI